jgi:hypothetical protein
MSVRRFTGSAESTIRDADLDFPSSRAAIHE